MKRSVDNQFLKLAALKACNDDGAVNLFWFE